MHKIGRAGSVIPLPFGKQRSRRKLRVSISRILSETSLTENTEELTERDDSIVESLGECSFRWEDSVYESKPQNELEEDIFVPLDQNEFLVECFMTNEYSDVTFIVHFYNEESAIGDSIEDCLLVRSEAAGSHCQLRRVNARHAPLFTKKLGIDTEQSTVLAIRNGAIISRISDISSCGCWELEKWIADTGVLEKKQNLSEFQSLNTLSC